MSIEISEFIKLQCLREIGLNLRFMTSRLLIFMFAVGGIGSAATIQGTITANEDNQPMIGATVVLLNTQLGAASNLEGRFQIENVPSGEYLLRVNMLGYAAEERQISLSDGQFLELDFSLFEKALDLDEVVIEGAAESGSSIRELEDRLQSVKITDGVSSETIQRVPDPTVASVVRRATGVSTMEGDPIIRGLGLRYSKVSLNNALIAGTEPNRSAVSLDLFPSSMMNQITINKSYTPDQFGEFAGGVVCMDTWKALGDNSLTVSLKSAANSQTTGRNFLTYDGGDLDILGFDDGTREMPSEIRNAPSKIVLRGRFSDTGFTAEELEALSESFSNNWNTRTVRAAPNQSFNFALTRTSRLWNRKFDYSFSGLYSNSNSFVEKNRNVFKGGTDGQVTRQHHYDLQSYSRSIGLGGVTAFRYEPSLTSRLYFQSLYNHKLSDETRTFDGWNDDRGKFVKDTRLRFVSENTFNNQLAGNHVFPALMSSMLDWKMSYSLGTRYEPDTREVQYEADPEDEVFVLADETQSGSRIFNDLTDHTVTATADWRLYPFGETGTAVKSGLAWVSRWRDSQTRFFQFEPQTYHTVDITQEPETIFQPENIGTDGFLVREATRPTDSYDASQTITAAYMMFEQVVSSRICVMAGARIEQSHQEVTSYELFTASSTPVVGKLDNFDVLPAANLIYQLRDRENLRFSVSQTVSRPDFRELSEFEFTDIIGGHAVIGNPNLERALIRNFDVRWEKMHGSSNLLGVSLFYKHFDNPVEVTIQPTAQNRVSYENAEGADNWGAEFEIRQNLGDLHESWSALAVSTNLTLVHSDITLSDSTKGIQTSSSRPLHGQSPYLVNVGLNYRHPISATQIDAYTHVFGKRIVEVGTKPLPDIYEMPHPDFDISLRQPLGGGFRLSFIAQNILDPEIRFEQGNDYTESYRLGRIYSIGLNYNR